MSLISQRTLDALDDIDIIDGLSRLYNLSFIRRGRSMICCCPFHNERTPSFHVNGNLWKCFGCDKKGAGLVNFVMEHDGLCFPDAVKLVANAFNISIEYENDQRTDAEKAAFERRESLKIVMQYAQEFYTSQLCANTPEASAARQYAYSRWGEESCKMYGIGYAPRDSQVIIEYFKRKSISLDLLIECGLLCQDAERGNIYALLRERITLPVYDRYHTPISYTARYIGSNTETAKRSKYMNLSATPLFRKGETLYGIDSAIRASKTAGHFTIVEGAPDALRLHIIGVPQAVAPLGTALTEEHLSVLYKHCRSLVFIPDSDPPKGKVHGAGVEAVMRNGKLSLLMGFDVNVKEIPRTTKDDEMGVKYDADSYITDKSIYSSLETIPFVIWYTRKRLGINPIATLQSEVIDEVADMLMKIPDENLREIFIGKLAKIVGDLKTWRNAIKRSSRKSYEITSDNSNDVFDDKILSSLKRIGLIVRDKRYYYPNKDGEPEPITNFIIQPILHIDGGRSIRILKLINRYGRETVMEFTPGDLVGARDFAKRIMEKGDYSLDVPTGLAPILKHILEVTDTATLVDTLGWNPAENFYAYSNGVFSDGQFIKADELGVVVVNKRRYFLPAFSELYTNNDLAYSFERLYRCNPQGYTSLNDFVSQIVKVYGDGGMVGFAWTLAAIFRDIIFNGLKYFPIFNLFGRKGSGKTELARALSSLFYVLPATPQSCSNTSIPVIGYNLSHARNSVYILDEYTNELMPQRIDLFKNIWGGTARSKMNEGTPEMIPVNQAVIIAGQYRPEDEALFSRVIHIMYNKTTFTTEEKSAFKTLREMVLHGNTHLLLQILSLREVFEKGYFPAFDLTLNDVLSRVGDAKVEDRILNNWVVALAAFRTLEGHLTVPFSYAELLKVVVDGILYQNDQIRKSSDTANFWTFLDSMHAHGLAKENCHFVIRKCNSFRGTRREQVDFIEPKRIIKLNWKAIRALFDSRFFKQKNTAMLDIATLESYLKSLPQFLGPQVQRFQILRTNGELDETYTSQNGTSTKQMTTTPSNALCFDYDSLQASIDLHLETIRISEEEFNAQLDEVEEPSSPSLTSDPPSLFQKDKDEELPF